MNYKNMREYTHDEFIDLVTSLKEEELLEFIGGLNESNIS